MGALKAISRWLSHRERAAQPKVCTRITPRRYLRRQILQRTFNSRYKCERLSRLLAQLSLAIKTNIADEWSKSYSCWHNVRLRKSLNRAGVKAYNKLLSTKTVKLSPKKILLNISAIIPKRITLQFIVYNHCPGFRYIQIIRIMCKKTSILCLKQKQQMEC